MTACAVDSCGPGGPTTGIFIASVSYGRKIRDVILSKCSEIKAQDITVVEVK